MFHRRRLALPSFSSTLLNSSTLNSSTLLSSLNPSTPLHPSNLPSSLNSSNLPSSLNAPVKGEQDEKVDKKGTKNKRADKNSSSEKRIEILIRDAFGTFKGEVPYYSARIMSIPEVDVPGLEELDEMYEEWIEKGEEK